MTNPNRTVVTVAVYNAVVRDLVKTNVEIERLQAKIKKYEDEQCAACRACRQIEERAALEPKP